MPIPTSATTPWPCQESNSCAKSWSQQDRTSHARSDHRATGRPELAWTLKRCPTASRSNTGKSKEPGLQVYQDASGHVQTLSLDEYTSAFMRSGQMLYEDPVPVICYAAFFIQNLAPALRSKVEAVFQEHIGPQVMTNEVQFDLMNRATAAAVQCEREIAVTADIVRQTAVSSMTAVIKQHGGSGASYASALTSTSSGSPAAAPLVLASQAESFMNERRCFACNRPMGRDASKGQCRGMRSSNCPMKDDPAAMEKAKVREAEFKAWKAKNPGTRGAKKKKGSFKERINRKVQAAVTKALEEAASGTGPAPQPATAVAAKSAATAGQAAAATSQAAASAVAPPLPSVAVPQPPPQGPVPRFGSDNSVAAASMASTAVPPHQAYYGPPDAYQTRGRYRPVRSSPYYDPRGDPRYGGSQNGPRRMFPVHILKAAVGASKPMIPAEIVATLPHLVFAVGRNDEPRETHALLDGLCDSGAQVNTFKLSTMMKFAKACPQYVKAIIDSKDGKYSAMPLAGAVGDSAVIGALSTRLPVLVVLYTPYIRSDGSPVLMSFACGECLSIRCIIGMPTLLDMGPAVIELNSKRVLCPNWDVQQLPLKFNPPSDEPLLIDRAPTSPMSNECAQSRAKSDVKTVHAVCNAILERHCDPLLEVRDTCKNTAGYGKFNSSGRDANPIFDPASTLDLPTGGPGSFTCDRDPDPVQFAINVDDDFKGLDEQWNINVYDEDCNYYDPMGWTEAEITGLRHEPEGGM